MSFVITTLTAGQTWALRHQAMWPDKPLDFVKLPHDAQGEHFGLWQGETLVSVVSCFRQAASVQFRKFATLPQAQQQGFGTILLRFVINHYRSGGFEEIWCHARQEKAAFYMRFGLQTDGTVFARDGKTYCRMCMFLR